MNFDREGTCVPIITAFLQPYPADLYAADDEEEATHCSLAEMQASLFRRPPTSCTTPGRMRPAGFNRNGRLVPAKWIPAKTDKRAGK